VRLAPRLRCTLIALASERAKVLCWSQQDLPLRLELLEHQSLTARLERAIGLGEAAAGALRGAIRFLRNGADSIVHKTTQGRRGEFESDRYFWQALEHPFKQWLNQCSDNSDAASDQWRQAVRTAAQQSFSRVAGFGARHARQLRARVAAEFQFNCSLDKLGLAS
jgi:hypothetical protein